MTQSITKRIEELEHAANTAAGLGAMLLITRDNGATFQGNGRTYSGAEVDALDAAGADLTIVNIYREAIAPMPDARLILSLPDSGRD